MLGKIWRRGWRVLYTASWRARLRACGPRVEIYGPLRVEDPRGVAIGASVTIREYGWLNTAAGRARATLVIGEGTYVGRFVHINAAREVVLEPRVLIADRVFITDYHHGTTDPDTPVIDQPLTDAQPVRLCEGCWIGEGAVIMPGVTIGRHAIVGANAVVTRDVPPGMVARGVPARVYPRRTGSPDSQAPGGKTRE